MECCGSAVTLSALFLLIPQLLGVFFLGNVVKVAVTVHHPAAITAEGVFVPLAFGLLLSFLLVARTESDAGLGLEVYADCDRLACHRQRQRLAVL